MDHVWIVIEIDYVYNLERLASIHDNEEIAYQAIDYYNSLLPNGSGIEYLVQNWTIVKDLKMITESTTVDINEETKIIN
jgi:hypothetical protein